MQKCAFFGHSDCRGMEDKIRTAISTLINRGVTVYFSGGMGQFDKLCEEAVRALGGELVLVACNIKQLHEKDMLRYDDIICPPGKKSYSKHDVSDRNKWLVDHADVALCYVHKDGAAKSTLNYAVESNKMIINLADTNPSLR